MFFLGNESEHLLSTTASILFMLFGTDTPQNLYTLNLGQNAQAVFPTEILNQCAKQEADPCDNLLMNNLLENYG